MTETSSSDRARAAAGKAVNLAASVVRGIATLFAIILALKVILVIGNANADNAIVRRIDDTADPLALAFKNLFSPDSMKTMILVNYGLAAIFWLVVGAVLANVIRRLA